MSGVVEPGTEPPEPPSFPETTSPNTVELPVVGEEETVVFAAIDAGPPLRLALVALYVAIGLVAGVIAGVVWWAVVDLPGYTVASDGSAATTQRGLTEVFGSDAWFCAIGLVCGLGLGCLAWWWFGRIGWFSAVFALVVTGIASALCWWIGWILGPGPLSARLVAAKPGDFVPIELTVRAPVAIAVWVAAGVLPILIRSSLGPDPEEPRPSRRRSRTTSP